MTEPRTRWSGAPRNAVEGGSRLCCCLATGLATLCLLHLTGGGLRAGGLLSPVGGVGVLASVVGVTVVVVVTLGRSGGGSAGGLLAPLGHPVGVLVVPALVRVAVVVVVALPGVGLVAVLLRLDRRSLLLGRLHLGLVDHGGGGVVDLGDLDVRSVGVGSVGVRGFDFGVGRCLVVDLGGRIDVGRLLLDGGLV